MKKEFVVANDGFLDSVHRTKGERVMLTERQAEHLLISGQIARPEVEDAPAQSGEAPLGDGEADDAQPTRSRRR